MKITRVEPLLVDRYLFVQVHTDAGHHRPRRVRRLGLPRGVGRRSSRPSSATWSARTRCGSSTTGSTCTAGPTSAARRSWAPSAPSTSRSGTSPASTSACRSTSCSAARCRDKARVYYHVFGQTREELVQGCIDAKEAGLHRRRPPDAVPGRARATCPTSRPTPPRCGDAIETVRQYREAVGDEVDLCIEIHRRLTPGRGDRAGARHRAVPPLLLRGPDPAGQLRRDGRWWPQQIHIPIATGERLHTIYEFEMLLARGAVQYVRPDVCMCGGHHRREEDRRAGRGAPRRGRAAQPARPGQHRRLPPDRRLHPELRPAGVPASARTCRRRARS